HQLSIEDRRGARYFVDGYKTIDAHKGRGVWPDTTTLFFTLHDGADSRGRRAGHGAVEVRVRDLLHQVSTMRARPGSRFLASFARFSRIASQTATNSGRLMALLPPHAPDIRLQSPSYFSASPT